VLPLGISRNHISTKLGGVMKSKKFTKSSIVDAIYEKTQLDRTAVRNMVEMCLNEIKDALLRHEDIELRGFGTFKVKMRKGRSKARNPRTGELIPTRPYSAVVFRPGNKLKDSIKALSDEAELE